MDELRTILSTREPFYARADAVIDTSGRSVDSGANEILEVIASGSAPASEVSAQAKQARPTARAKKSR